MLTNDETTITSDTTTTNRRLLWLAIVVVGVVYFFVAHNFQVSQHEGYAPWSDAEDTLEAGQNVTKGLALSLIGLLGVYLILRRDGRPLNLTGWLPAIMIFYVAWAMASVLWSVNPSMTCKRLAVLMFCILAAVGFARQFRPRDIALMAMVISGAYLLVGVGTELALGTFQPWSSGYRFAGTVHPNSQGAHLTILCLASYCLARSATRGKAWLWSLFALGIIFLLLTKSRTACAALAIALAALWLLDASRRTQVLIALTAAFVICAAALTGTLFGIDLDDKIAETAMLGRQEGSEGLTGRIPIWTELLSYVQAKPFQGYGYESFWTSKHIEAVSDEMQWPLREAHNAYIDGTLSVGLIGVATFLAAVAISLLRAAVAYGNTRDPGFAFTFCMLVFGLLNACLESGMMSPSFATLMAGSGVLQLMLPSPFGRGAGGEGLEDACTRDETFFDPQPSP